MNSNNSCYFYLDHESAQAFFDEAFHPDLDALARRDEFIQRANEESPYWHEGNDLVTEIPDIDIAALRNAENEYQEVKATGFFMQPIFQMFDIESHYEEISMLDLAVAA